VNGLFVIPFSFYRSNVFRDGSSLIPHDHLEDSISLNLCPSSVMGASIWPYVISLIPFTGKTAARSSRSSRSSSNEKPQQAQIFPTDSIVEHDFHREEIVAAAVDQTHQSVLLLLQPRSKYDLTHEYPIPSIEGDRELLVKVQAVGLNPIDWKAPDYNFGIPQLPYISGRDLVGTVIRAPKSASRIKVGDVVIAISTDYRDLRKAAFQQFAVGTDFNVCRLPRGIQKHEGAPIGVAFVAAALGLGICLGTDFSKIGGGANGPDLLNIFETTEGINLPEDIREECLNGIRESERPKVGDWIAVWGGSSTTALYFSQLAKLFGFKVILIVDVGKHGARLSERGADLLVDCHDQDRAVAIIRAVTASKLRFAIDCSGKETAARLLEAFETIEDDNLNRGHLIGLTGLPKVGKPGVVFHTVPIKAYHEVREVGESLMTWLERLLAGSHVTSPDVSLAEGGLSGVNDALDRMRRGEISGRRLVVQL